MSEHEEVVQNVEPTQDSDNDSGLWSFELETLDLGSK